MFQESALTRLLDTSFEAASRRLRTRGTKGIRFLENAPCASQIALGWAAGAEARPTGSGSAPRSLPRPRRRGRDIAPAPDRLARLRERAMTSKLDGINPAAKPSGTGCLECSASGRMVVPSAPLRRMRAHRLLRQFAKSACDETQRRDRPPDHREFRAGRGLVLRLSHWRCLRRRELHPPRSHPFDQPTPGPARRRAGKLAGVAQRIGVCSGAGRRARLAGASWV